MLEFLSAGSQKNYVTGQLSTGYKKKTTRRCGMTVNGTTIHTTSNAVDVSNYNLTTEKPSTGENPYRILSFVIFSITSGMFCPEALHRIWFRFV